MTHPPHIEPMDVLILRGLVAGLDEIKNRQRRQVEEMEVFLAKMKDDTQRLLDRYRMAVEAKERDRDPK